MTNLDKLPMMPGMGNRIAEQIMSNMKRLLSILAPICLLLPGNTSAMVRPLPYAAQAASFQSTSLQTQSDYTLVPVNVYLGLEADMCRNDPVDFRDPLGLTWNPIVNAILRSVAGSIERFGLESSSSSLAYATGAASSLMQDAAYMGSAESGVDSYNSSVQSTAAVIQQQMEMGEGGFHSGAVGVGYGLGTILGYTDAYEVLYGYDVPYQRELSGAERITRGASATSKMAGTFAGLKAGSSRGAPVKTEIKPPPLPVDVPVVAAKSPITDPARLLSVGKADPFHHIFPQRADLASEFGKRGVNIDKFAMQLRRDLHIDLHRGAPRGGQWNKAWEDFFKANPNATDVDIYKNAGNLIYDFEVPGRTVVPYRR